MEIPQLKRLNDDKSIIFDLQTILSSEIKFLFGLDTNVFDIEVNRASDSKFGDYTSNIALKVSGELKKKPHEIGIELKDAIFSKMIDGNHSDDIYSKLTAVEVAGPGFLNFYINEKVYFENLLNILEKGIEYGKWEIANGQVMVEFGQPNTHKAITAGHIKSGITGLATCRIYRNLGYEVIQANYFSDIGLNAAKSTWQFMQNGEPEGFDNWPLNQKMEYIANCYAEAHKQFKESPEIADEIKNLNKTIYDKSDAEVFKTYLKLRGISIEQQDEVFAKLGIIFDRQYPESEVAEHGLQLVNENIGKVFIEDQGAIVFPGEKYGMNRWVFRNSLGLPTYSGKDLGLGYKKFEEYPELVFNLTMTSTEQISYFDAVIKALELIDKKFVERYFFKGFGWLLRDGKKMSSKQGNAVGVEDMFGDAYDFSKKKISENKKYSEEESHEITEKVVLAGLKFLFLSREFHMDINYDPNQFLNPDGFSGPYVLYAYVRAKSILREAGEYENNYGEYKYNSDELSLLKMLYQYPFAALNAGKNTSPHIIANYIFELAQEFNKFYKNNKVLVDDNDTKNFRLALTDAAAITLQNGMYLLGIETIEKM